MCKPTIEQVVAKRQALVEKKKELEATHKKALGAYKDGIAKCEQLIREYKNNNGLAKLSTDAATVFDKENTYLAVAAADWQEYVDWALDQEAPGMLFSKTLPKTELLERMKDGVQLPECVKVTKEISLQFRKA